MPEPVVIYTFTPQFEGAYLKDVPKRDLTAVDVANMTGAQMRDAFSPHPVHGTPLYTPVDPSSAPDFSHVHEAPIEIISEEEQAQRRAAGAAEAKRKADAAKATTKDTGKDGES